VEISESATAKRVALERYVAKGSAQKIAVYKEDVYN